MEIYRRYDEIVGKDLMQIACWAWSASRQVKGVAVRDVFEDSKSGSTFVRFHGTEEGQKDAADILEEILIENWDAGFGTAYEHGIVFCNIEGPFKPSVVNPRTYQ